MGSLGFQARPLSVPGSCRVDFGAEVTGVDLNNLSEEDFKLLRDCLYTSQVVVVRDQQALTPRAQYELTRRFDPETDIYGHGKTIDKRSILHKDLKTIPHQPQVQVIGHGFVESFEGLENIQLKHPHHNTFHKYPVSAEEGDDCTHFYRWHIDAALYSLNPPLVTSLLAVTVPKGRRQICRWDDGTGAELDVPLGTTAFFSGYRLYQMLSEEDKEFARTSRVEYAAHPYVWISSAHARSNGLGLFSEGLEIPDDKLPPIEVAKVKTYPMVWKNPVTSEYALMVYGIPMRRIHLESGEVLDNLAEIRERIYKLQRPGIDPELVYPHDWEEGDLVLFNNHGVMHSVVGSLRDGETRIFRQCNLAASRAPLGPDTN